MRPGKRGDYFRIDMVLHVFASFLLACVIFFSQSAVYAAAPGNSALLEEGSPARAIQDMIGFMKQYKDINDKGLSAEEKEKSLAIKEKISSILDIPEMSRLILKNHWDKLTAQEKKRYSSLMVQLVETIAYPQAEEYFNSGLRIDYNDVKMIEDGSASEVDTSVVYEGKDFELSSIFYLRKKSGAWRIYDIVTEGESLLLIYRNQHMRIIKEKGFAQLISLMEKKLEKVKEEEK